MKTLSKKQVLQLRNDLLEEFGGTAGVRDDGLLESVLNQTLKKKYRCANRIAA